MKVSVSTTEFSGRKYKTLYNIDKLNNYFTSNGTGKIRLQELGPAIPITHVNHFKKLFPGVDLSAPR